MRVDEEVVDVALQDLVTDDLLFESLVIVFAQARNDAFGDVSRHQWGQEPEKQMNNRFETVWQDTGEPRGSLQKLGRSLTRAEETESTPGRSVSAYVTGASDTLHRFLFAAFRLCTAHKCGLPAISLDFSTPSVSFATHKTILRFRILPGTSLVPDAFATQHQHDEDFGSADFPENVALFR